MTRTILKINASARTEDSASRPLVDRVVDRLSGPDTRVIDRDLADPLPQLSEGWLAANWTAADARTGDQRAALALSDTLIAELKAADTLVIGAPIYNFSVPAALKAWIDLIARNGETFAYTPDGPKGLLEGKRAVIVLASGGVPMDAPMDHATPLLRTIMGFVGIEDVTFIDASTLVANSDTVVPRAQAEIDALTGPALAA